MTTAEERKKARERKEKAHARHVLKTYGITVDAYWKLYNFQGGKCALCMVATGKTKRLAVDHDHRCKAGHDPKTGCPECVRGLTCGSCNRLIGRLRDDPRAFERGARYLREPPFQALRQRSASQQAA